ncbi:MAG TPA: thioredoxin family protein [bacterium]|nr:thioredoxin family protein [bacterium]
MNKMAGSAILIGLLFLHACNGPENTAQDSSKKSASQAKITFIELGSVNCIPCKAMQPVMKAIEERYGDQIEVIFYDVWKAEQKKYAQEYHIRLIPTQVFLDAKGKEIFRHEGFFPETEIDALLQSHGLKSSRQSES